MQQFKLTSNNTICVPPIDIDIANIFASCKEYQCHHMTFSNFLKRYLDFVICYCLLLHRCTEQWTYFLIDRISGMCWCVHSHSAVSSVIRVMVTVWKTALILTCCCSFIRTEVVLLKQKWSALEKEVTLRYFSPHSYTSSKVINHHMANCW